MALGDLNIKVGADIADALTKINELKKANLALAEETRDLSRQYNTNAKELRALEEVQASGIKLNQQQIKTLADRIKTEKVLAAQIVDNKNVLKESNAVVRDFDKSQQSAAKATGGFAGGLKNVYTGLSKIANIIPGLGIGTLVGLIAGPLITALTDWVEAANSVGNASKLMSDTLDAAAGKYATAVENVSRLKEEINLAKQGFLDKDKVVKDYNESIGKTTGFVKTLDEAEKALNKNAEAYIKFTFLKAVANEANAAAAKKSVEAALAALKPQAEFVTQGAALGQSLVQAFVHPLNNTSELLEGAGNRLVDTAEKNRKKVIDSANSDSNALKLMAKKFGDEAAALAQQFHFNPFEDNKEEKEIKKSARKHAVVYTETLQHALAELFAKGFQRAPDPFADLIKGSKGKISVDLSGIKENLAAIAALDAAKAIALGKLREFQAQVDNIIQNMASSIVDGLSGAFETAFSGGSFGKSLFTSIFSALGSAMQQLGKVAIETGLGIKAIKTALETLQPLVAIAAGVSLLALGALIKSQASKIGGFAEGGEVKGPGGPKSDSILARLSPGEYVLKSEAVKRITVPVLNKLNQGGTPSFINGIARFANGGFVSPSLLGSIIGGQAIQVEITGRLKGNDIYVSNQRAGITRGRNS